MSSAFAEPLPTGPVYVESIAVIESPTAGHAAGNFEIKLRDALPAMPGISCQNFYITTKKTNDPDSRIFMLLTLAQIKKIPVNLYITDDPNYAAMYGRCSITAVVLI